MRQTLLFPPQPDYTGPVMFRPSWGNYMKQEVDDLKAEMLLEFPDFRVVPKDSSYLMRFLNVVLLVISFGAQRNFMTSFTTIVGRTMYTPRGWEDSAHTNQLATLRHERVHFRQQRRYTRFLFSVLYLFVLPLGFAFFRTKFEKEAYEESMLVYALRYGAGALRESAYRERMIRHFTSGEYLWMWVIRSDIEKWYDDTAAAIERKLYA